MHCKATIGTDTDQVVLEVVSEYRWSQEQVSLYPPPPPHTHTHTGWAGWAGCSGPWPTQKIFHESTVKNRKPFNGHMDMM